MKRLFLVLLIVLFIPMSAGAEDYKKLYLDQKVLTISMELRALQMRYDKALSELSQAQGELIAYLSEVEEKESKKEEETEEK